MNEASIFAAAVEKTSTGERAAFLSAACGSNTQLRAHVEALLHAHENPDAFFDAPAVELGGTLATKAIAESVGTMVGPYKLREQIGEGGMGVVYVAEQLQPVRRKVALKLIKPGMDTRQVIARFEAERQALALMDHPNIAKVLEAGTADSGRPYFVMEFVRGIPITDYCDKARLTPRKRLELFTLVCQAVQHAHQKGIIHRDIKPSNVMVTLHDGVPVPKVIDFGVAKAINQRLTQQTVYTQSNQMVGTPLYMSPEQAELSGLDVDTRTDVYSLGVLLYELLTGSTPFDKETLRKASYDEIRRIIREEEPSKPSTLISTLGASLTTVSEQRGTDPRKLTQTVRGELDWIVMKALEKDRARRYESASALAADVRAYLADEPVMACEPTVTYRVWKWSRRHRTMVASGAVVLILAVIALSIGSALILREKHRTKTALATSQRNLQRANVNLLLAGQAVEGMFGQIAHFTVATSDAPKPSKEESLKQALKFYEAITSQDDPTPSMRFLRARALNRLGDVNRRLKTGMSFGRFDSTLDNKTAAAYQNALALFDDLVRECPTVLKYRQGLAASQSRLAGLWDGENKDEEQLERLRRLAKIYEDLADAFPSSLTVAGSPTDGHEHWGMIYDWFCSWPGYHEYMAAEVHVDIAWRIRATEDHKAIEQHCQRALSLCEEALAISDKIPRTILVANLHNVKAFAHKNLSTLLWKMDRQEQSRREFLKARRAYERAIELVPNYIKPYRRLARMLTTHPDPDLRDPGRALDLALEMTRLTPEHARSWVEAARHLATSPDPALRDLIKAVDFTTVAVYLAPNDLRVLNDAGLVYAEAHNWHEAVNAFERSMELGARLARNNLAWLLATCPDPEVRDAKRAIELAEQAVEQSLEDGNILNTPGVAYYRARGWKKSIETLGKAMDLRSGGNSFDWFFLAMAHWQLGNEEEAHRWYDQAVAWMQENSPEDEELVRFRAEAEELLGIKSKRASGRVSEAEGGESRADNALSPAGAVEDEPGRPPLESTQESPSQSREAAAENSQGRKPLERELEFNPVPTQQGEKLFLEGQGAMMIGLLGKVTFDALEVRAAGGKGAVPGLPGKIGFLCKGLVNPFGGVALDGPKGIGHGALLVQRNQQMDVVGHPARRQQGAVFRAQDAAEVFVEARLKVGGDHRGAVLGAENDVTGQTGEGLGHGVARACELPPLRG